MLAAPLEEPVRAVEGVEGAAAVPEAGLGKSHWAWQTDHSCKEGAQCRLRQAWQQAH